MEKPYWIVISERGPSSRPYRHGTQQGAIDEALRLTRLHGGQFTVFEAQLCAIKNDVVLKRFGSDDDIPF
jgi:hypothetical protein